MIIWLKGLIGGILIGFILFISSFLGEIYSKPLDITLLPIKGLIEAVCNNSSTVICFFSYAIILIGYFALIGTLIGLAIEKLRK